MATLPHSERACVAGLRRAALFTSAETLAGESSFTRTWNSVNSGRKRSSRFQSQAPPLMAVRTLVPPPFTAIGTRGAPSLRRSRLPHHLRRALMQLLHDEKIFFHRARPEADVTLGAHHLQQPPHAHRKPPEPNHAVLDAETRVLTLPPKVLRRIPVVAAGQPRASSFPAAG